MQIVRFVDEREKRRTKLQARLARQRKQLLQVVRPNRLACRYTREITRVLDCPLARITAVIGGDD